MSDTQQRTNAYPQPPFPEQPQTPPGLASEMQPVPDHGETSYKGHGRLAGKKALITGGDSGIGRAVAIAYAREGADVAINYLPEEEKDAAEVIDLIKAEGRNAVALPGDVRDETFCQNLVEEAVSKLGGLDILVNNAGRQQFRESLEELTTEDFDATFKTNVYAPFWITKAALRHLKASSVIINTSSVQAVKPSPGAAGLRPDQSLSGGIYQILSQAAGSERHSRQRGRSWPLLDGTAVQRRPADGKSEGVWRRYPAGTSGSARRDCPAVRHAGLG